jgi:hypothetical protein
MEAKRKFRVLVLFCISIFNLTLSVYADGPDIQWQKTFGGSADDWGHSVQQTSDGGFIILGETYSYGGVGKPNVYLLKTDSSGNLVWQQTYGGLGWDFGNSVRQTADGGFIITGYTDSFGSGYDDVYLIKTNSAGDILWQNTFGGIVNDWGYSVQQTSDGGFIIAGYIDSPPALGIDVYLIKTNSAGTMLWQKNFGGDYYDFGHSVQQTDDGGYIITGRKGYEDSGTSDVYLIKTNSSGNLLWQKTFGGSKYEDGWSVQQTSDGGFIIAGETTSFGAGGYDVYLIKTDSSGNSIWQKTFGGSKDDHGYSVQQTSDGGYIIAGYTNSFGSGKSDIYIVKTDSAGNLLWQKTIGGTNYDEGWSIQQTSDGGFIIAGDSYSYGTGGFDVYVVKLAASANIPGNLDYDSDVDCYDLERFVSNWLNIECSNENIWCSGADLDKNGYVDIVDLAIFSNHWLEGVNP